MSFLAVNVFTFTGIDFQEDQLYLLGICHTAFHLNRLRVVESSVLSKVSLLLC